MRKIKKIAIWSAIIIGANVAGLHGFSALGSLAWCARTVSQAFVGTANALQ